MKHSRRYIVFALVLAMVFTLQFHILELDTNQIGKFRGAVLAEEIWNPIIAKDVNDNGIRIVIDNKVYSGKDYNFYMNANRSVMVPVEILTETLKCSASVYNEKQLVVKKYTNYIRMPMDESVARMNGEDVLLKSPFVSYKGEYYVSIEELAKLLGYEVKFDIDTFTLNAVNKVELTSFVPTRFDLREEGRVSTVRNQGAYGTCWAFAAVCAIESRLRPEENTLYSVDHMTMNNSFHSNQYDGGEYTMGMAYLAAWQGPVFETDDPYGDGKTNNSLHAEKHVQEMQIIESKDLKRIKECVFLYGGVQSSLYSTMNTKNQSNRYYNGDTNSYCYIGTEKPNHDILIVGWDDNYSKSNFNVPLEGDGAFICQNSWGTDFGEDGFFYVSYYDTNIGTHNVVYTKIEEKNNYDRIYQSDLCGWVGKIGYNEEDMYGANVYTAAEAERICAAGFYATGPNTEYEVYVVKNFVNENSFEKKEKVASGVLENAGYYTVNFERTIDVQQGEKFAIVLYVKTPGAEHPMAIEYDNGDYIMLDVDLTDGESYISYSGLKFTNVKATKNCDLCIKAYTKER